MERINRIKEIFGSEGISQENLAEKMDKTQSHLKDIKGIAAILNIDISQLLAPTLLKS